MGCLLYTSVLPFIWTYAVFNCMMSFVNGTGAVKYTTVVNLLILWAVGRQLAKKKQ